MTKRLSMLLTACCLMAAMSVPASALEYSFDAPDAGLFGRPTSDETIYVTTDEPANTDRSKNAAYIPPAFGSPTSYTLNNWERLTPNLVSQTTAVNFINTSANGVTVIPPSLTNPGTGNGGNVSTVISGYTEVTSDLYYSSGHIGTLKIPAIGLTVKVYQGTDSAALAKGAGHFESTSIWNGNVAIAGHNRGANDHFGNIHTLDIGDEIKWITKLGTRSYEVFSVAKVSVNDLSVLDSSAENIITLITCVKNQSDYRWCVQAAA